VALNTVPVTLEELSQKARRTSGKDTRVFPSSSEGDRATQYQVIMDVLNVVGNLGNHPDRSCY